MNGIRLLCFATALALVATVASADSITPGSKTWNDPIPGNLEIFDKTVVISQSASTLVDVFFLYDVSGTMGGAVESAAAFAQDLISDLMTTYGGTDQLGVGVGYYTTVPTYPFGWGDPADPDGPHPTGHVDSPWTLSRSITTNLGLAQTAFENLPFAPVGVREIDSIPTSQLYALQQAAGSAGWRDGSAKILVWVGDTPGWDPVADPDLAAYYPAAYSTSLADAIAALTSQGIIVEALSAGSSYGLNVAFDASDLFGLPANTITVASGQATAITGATGGALGALGTSGNLAAIKSAIDAAFAALTSNYTAVGLDLSDALGEGVTIEYRQAGTAAWNNAPYIGAYDRSVDRTFEFEVRVTFPPDVGGADYIFNVWATVDGRRVVSELDQIIYGGTDIPTTDVPEPSTLALLGLGFAGLGLAVRRKLRK